MLGTEPVFAELSRALDLVELRHTVYASNIANISTDGYRRMEVIANDAAAAIGEASEFAPASMPVGQVVASADTTVHLDQEMAKMAKNALSFQSLIGAFERMSGLLRMAIHEGREG
jgi:flagellar basal body rod protein FlgB